MFHVGIIKMKKPDFIIDVKKIREKKPILHCVCVHIVHSLALNHHPTNAKEIKIENSFRI